MSWNNGNNNGSNQDPWAKPGTSESNGRDPKQPQGNNTSDQTERKGNTNNQELPDLVEIFENLLKKLTGNGGNANQNNGSFGLGKFLPIAIVIAIILWVISGFYTIKEAERGVVLRFGKVNGIVQPGLNWKPTFIDQIIPVNVERISELRAQGSMLTQDENMVTVEMTVQYRIQDPAQFLFNVVEPQDSLSQATDSALRYVIGHMTMDDILTTGRSVVRERTWKELNEIIKPYHMGLEVVDVNFQSARPPEAVKDAFDDAIKAQEDEQRLIREAEAYAREREPIARGNAQKIIEEANAYKQQVVLNAQGEAERFNQLLPEFKANPQIMKDRLYLDNMEKIMTATPKILLDNTGNNLTVLPLEQLLNQKTATKTAPQASSKLQPKASDLPTSPVQIHYPQERETLIQPQPNTRHGRFE
ncbi:FtsH protease activity modulator HflK [Mergibacter septicus]|uniref:FtsH protease activity modulator HflK n=1 Tax=Mergibacter septicus TaxID=221402 RepID=UPI001C776A8D|nr:FtsH protease activity modulator HflK [Mergibacter septicus]QDJ12361.1 FtsH protease activity modulator HflK [Mergibacter septicus]